MKCFQLWFKFHWSSIDNKSRIVYPNADQATGHHLNHYWDLYCLLYVVPRPRCINSPRFTQRDPHRCLGQSLLWHIEAGTKWPPFCRRHFKVDFLESRCMAWSNDGLVCWRICASPCLNELNNDCSTWWRHQMETFSALLAICAGNSPETGEFPHEGQWRGGALIFSLICVWINGWVNNREAGDLRRYRAHYDVSVMQFSIKLLSEETKLLSEETSHSWYHSEENSVTRLKSSISMFISKYFWWYSTATQS